MRKNLNVKSRTGSISIFVLVALLFMASFLIISYASNVNRSKIAKEQFNVTQGLYSYSGEDEGAYEKSYTDLRQKNKQTMTATSEETEDTASLELTKTFADKVSNYRIYGNSEKPVLLPKEYEEVEWIGTDGNSYFISNFNINNLDRFTIYYRYNTNGDSNNWMWGASDYPNNGSRFLHRYTNIMLNTKSNDIQGLVIPASNNLESIVIVANNIDKKITSYNGGTTDSEITWNNKKNFDNFGIFCNNYGRAPGSNKARSGSKIAELRFVNDETGQDVFNPIPCYRKSDNVIGMYDLVSGVFFTNEGTGTFTKGADIEIEGVGDLSSNNNDEKYKISIKLTNENGESETIDIYLDNSLKIGDYIDFKTKTVVRADGTVENIELPELSTFEDYTKIEVLTEVKPSKIEVEYTGYTLEGN